MSENQTQQSNEEYFIVDDPDDPFELPEPDPEEEKKRQEEERKRQEEERKKKLEEEEKKRLAEQFHTDNSASRRLLTDLRTIMHSDSQKLGFSTMPKGNNIFIWEVKVFGFEKGSDMYNDLQKYKQMKGIDYVEMSITFPNNYPFKPPFVRVVKPRFMFHTGHITVGGSICADILTMESWSPINDIESLMVNVISEIINGKPRIDFSYLEPYTLEEAKSAYVRVASEHHWKISDWLPKDEE